MRFVIFVLGTALSTFGLMGTFFLLQMALQSTCFQWYAVLPFLICAFAWVAYFRMGISWINDERLGWFWPIIGTVAGVLALNAGGVAFLSDDYSPRIMAVPALCAFPAILIAIWMVGFHVKRKT